MRIDKSKAIIPMKVHKYVFFSLCLLMSFGVFAEESVEIQPDNLFPRVKLETILGDIIVELDRTRAPITTNNFLRYVAKGSYDGTIFHRIVKDFVVQGGGYDPFLCRKIYPQADF